MEGTQKIICEGLRYLAQKVEDGAYGEGAEAFEDDEVAVAFLADLEEHVEDKVP